MRIHKTFVKVKLGEQTYILPYGQSIADHCTGITLNETGELLWEGTKKGYDTEKLLHLLKKEYALGDDMEKELARDITGFQRNLLTLGIAEITEPED